MSFVLAVLIALPAWAAPAEDPDLARGIRAVDEGDYETGILTLDAVARRLAGQREHQHDLAQAYLYLGIAYLAKGHETSARARFRDALREARDLTLSPDQYAPKVIELFEKAREDVIPVTPIATASSAAPRPASSPAAKKRGSGKLLLVGLGVAGAAGVAVAAGGGGGSSSPSASTPSGTRETTFPNEGMVVGGSRDFVIECRGSGTLTATVSWQPAGVLLDMFIVALSDPGRVLVDAGRTGTAEARLSLPVTAGNYRISVTNSSGQGVQEPSTFTLRVVHP